MQVVDTTSDRLLQLQLCFSGSPINHPQIFFHNLIDFHFLIYQRRSVPFTGMRKDLSWMWDHHSPTVDDNPSILCEDSIKFPVLSLFSTEALKVSNLFQTTFIKPVLISKCKSRIIFEWFCLTSSTL